MQPKSAVGKRICLLSMSAALMLAPPIAAASMSSEAPYAVRADALEAAINTEGISTEVFEFEATPAPTPEPTPTPEPRPAGLTANHEAAYRFLRGQMGLNQAAAAGIIANMVAESNMNPAISEIGVSNGGYGLCQWTGTRKSALKSFCAANGLSVASLDGQLKFFQYELTAPEYGSLLASLRALPNTAEGARQSAKDICIQFERPYKARAQAASRAEAAPALFEMLSWCDRNPA